MFSDEKIFSVDGVLISKMIDFKLFQEKRQKKNGGIFIIFFYKITNVLI